MAFAYLARRPGNFAILATVFLGLSIINEASGADAKDARDIELWRLDCGTMDIDDIAYFSDAFVYEGQSAFITNGCYLIRNGADYLLWDAGLPRDYLGNDDPEGGWTSALSVTIAQQLETLGVAKTEIDFFAPSHFHGDHIGQAAEVDHATLLMSEADVGWLKARPPGNAKRRLAPWFDGDAPLTTFRGDHDVFGDGSVTILATPGHTPGHSSLLVRLPQTGAVLLTGDLFHFRRELAMENVSRWNTSRADTLASIKRFHAIVAALDPLVIVQHEPDDVDLLPAFPKSAR